MNARNDSSSIQEDCPQDIALKKEKRKGLGSDIFCRPASKGKLGHKYAASNV